MSTTPEIIPLNGTTDLQVVTNFKPEDGQPIYSVEVTNPDPGADNELLNAVKDHIQNLFNTDEFLNSIQKDGVTAEAVNKALVSGLKDIKFSGKINENTTFNVAVNAVDPGVTVGFTVKF